MTHPQDLVQPPRLFQARRKVFPKAVSGPFRRFKWAVMAVTLLIYYMTPWLRWNRGPHAPDQAVLIDLAHRRFYLFAIEIWPHEFYYVAGLLIMAAVGLFLVTSAVGRAWCGYACPQTVWTDLFQHVERLVDGDRNAQLRLEKAPWTVSKLARRALKHSIWIVIGAVTGGAWIFYFADAPSLASALLRGDAPWIAYSTIAILTATTYVLGGLLREQVCQFMCPWPRIQAAMMDERSLVVTYRHWRGEPRTHGLKRSASSASASKENTPAQAQPFLVALAEKPHLAEKLVGDCIDCNACVAVCPAGIDIRQGPQIGCITCGLCIDACDDTMRRIGREPKLIGYTTELDARLEQTGSAPLPPIRRLLRTRTLVYLGGWSLIGATMLLALEGRERLEIDVNQSRNPVWVRLSDGAIRNGYDVRIRNMEARPREIELSVRGRASRLWDESGDRSTAGRSIRFRVAADKVAKHRVFLARPAFGPEREDVTFDMRALDQDGTHVVETSFFERPRQ